MNNNLNHEPQAESSPEAITLKTGKGGDKFILLQETDGEVQIRISNITSLSLMGLSGMLTSHAQKLYEKSQLKAEIKADLMGFLESIKP